MGVQGWLAGSLTWVVRCELQQPPSFSHWFPYLEDELVTSPQVSLRVPKVVDYLELSLVVEACNLSTGETEAIRQL